MVDASGSGWMGKYIIKREYSEGSHHVFGLTLPQLGPTSTSTDDLQLQQGRNAAHPVPSAAVGSHADPPQAGTSECSSDQTHTSIGFLLSHVKSAASKLIHLSSFLFQSAPSGISAQPGSQLEAELQPLGGQSSDLGPTIHNCINPDLAAHDTADILTQGSAQGGGDSAAQNGTWLYDGLQVTAELNSLLAEVADRLLHHSCGEGWLVQPRIANMSGLEYRVYLLGGASAVSALVPCSPLYLLAHGCHGWHIRGSFVILAAYIAEL